MNQPLTLRTLLASIFALGSFVSSFAFAEAPVKEDQTVLHLANGDYISGAIVDSGDPNRIGWKSPAFVSPFHFALEGIASIHFPTPTVPVQPEGNYCVELVGGDMLFGSLIGLDANEAVVEVPGMGRLSLDRTIIQRICRWGNKADQIYVGPSGLHGWQTGGDENVWREDAGHLITDKAGASLTRDFGIPNQVRIEFELSWTTQPGFELAVGVGNDPKTASRAFRFEVWDNEIVVQRETEREADVAPMQKISGKSGRLHLQVFLDQILGRILVFSSNGDPLADMTVQSAKPQVFGGIKLINHSGDVHLENLRIGRWNGEPPLNAEVNKSRIHGNDGTITYGSLMSFDADKHEFVTGDDLNQERIAEDRVHDIFLSQPKEVAPRALRAVFLSGMKISGDLITVTDQTVLLKSPGIREPVAVSFDKVQSLIAMRAKTEPPELPQRRGRFEMSGVKLHGCLVDGQEGETRCLVWQPISSNTSSPLVREISARIIYQDPPPPPANTPQTQQQQLQARVRVRRAGGIVGQIQGVIMDGEDRKPKPKNSNAKSVLHLRTGDTIPCSVTSIDERGVTFESTVTDAKFAPNDRIQTVELISNASSAMIESVKKKRLLTLPRMQRDNPPTHLVRSVDGDYLRGRLVSLDAEQLQIELRLESKIVRRERIVRIIWLHPEVLDPSANPAGNTLLTNANSIQAVPSNPNGSASERNRLTFVPEKVEGSILSGTSDLLGGCRVDLLNTDQLMIGAAIEQAAAELAFQSWKLKPSADPLAPKEPSEGSGDSSEGQESALIGKPAPEIALLAVDGAKFQLSDHKQKVVILDFWASWCGPCLQVMPQVDRVAQEFADQGVELFAVNLEETPEKVKAALDRLKLSTNVVLDRDGRVAERYGATSIPQTVIINREGKVVRVFVGGSARFDDQLRMALKSVLAGESVTPSP